MTRSDFTTSLARSAQQISTAAATISGQPAPVRGATNRSAQSDLAAVAEEVGLAAERLAAVAASAVQVPTLSALGRLRAFIAVNAVFFGNGDDYRDQSRAQRVIGEVAQLAKETRAIVRVVGYTDERGTQGRNSPLAQARANKVASALVALGVPRNRLVTVGRSTGPDISPSTGPDSANRRVEFEIGFEGEAAAK